MQQPSLFAKLLRGAGAALTVQLISAITVYSSQVLLARWMGTAEYGIYDYATALVIIGAFIAGFGLPTAVLRFISAYQAQGDWSHLRGIIESSWRQTLIIGFVASLFGTAVLLRLNSAHGLEAYTIPLSIGMWTIPIVALVNLQREIIRAFQQIILAYAPSLIMQPLLLTGMIAVWRLRHTLTSTSTIALSLLSTQSAMLDPHMRTVSGGRLLCP